MRNHMLPLISSAGAACANIAAKEVESLARLMTAPSPRLANWPIKWIWPDPRGSFDGPAVVAKCNGEIVYLSYVVMPSAWDANR